MLHFTLCKVLVNWLQWTNILIMLGVSQLSENHLNHPNLVTMFHYSKSVFSLYHIYFEGYELKLYLNRKLPRVIIDGLKISNDFEIQHFDFWVEFHLEGFPEEARRRNKEKEENNEYFY